MTYDEQHSYELEEDLMAQAPPTSAEATPYDGAVTPRGGESAHEWVVRAINGDDVPESQRSEYNKETVFGSGSANICCLQAACDGWYWWHRDKAKARKVLEAWEGYLGLDRWFTSEPWSSHRYGTWITMSYLAVAHLAKKLGNMTVMDGIERYLRFEMFSTVLTMGWNRTPQEGYPYARGGSRSWCGWDGPNGKGTGEPYQHLVEEGSIGKNVNNWIGKRSEANWEAEPIIKKMEQKQGYTRWEFLSDSEKNLTLRLVNYSTQLDAGGQSDLDDLLLKISNCGAKNHINVHMVKTTLGTGFLCEKTHGSGSTSFMVGKVWYVNHRNANENQQVWADDFSVHFAPIFEGNKARRSDPGGFGSIEHDGSKFIFKAWTGNGDCANGFEPGPNKHNNGDHNPRNVASWLNGPQVVTLSGDIIWWVKYEGKQAKVVNMMGDSPPVEPPIDPPDPPVDPPTDPGNVPPGGWNTVTTPHSAYMKMKNQEVWDSYQRILAGGHGSNHMITRECAVEGQDVPSVKQQLEAIINSW